ncbi:MAG TPA: response regulator [Leptolyngbyaceae cyanobacterium M33_DOE_097]|uniref:histidine kinase n=1 Tax=Oscillatoriales cyanobacterium SpSt-418 TaxID=2282169 RepID=A0A7C3PPS3_9CYAN|nr:response regulator [Leptolyngbyaceae cyanobacterium M33_DOE_097]
MPVLQTRLEQFVCQGPVCSDTTTLATGFDLIQRSSDLTLLIVNTEQKPLGYLALADFVRNGWVGLGTIAPDAPLHVAIQNLQPSPLQPVIVVSTQQIVQDVLPILQSGDRCVVVQPDGAIAGWLDRDRLFAALAAELNMAAAAGSAHTAIAPSPELSESMLAETVNHPFDSKLKALQQASPLAALDPLLGLLESLPIALMLQTEDGQVITRNALWRQQIDAFQTPEFLHQEIASFLENTDFSLDEGTESRPTQSEPDTPPAPPETSAYRGVCRLGSKPNTCICTCTLSNGQEQVLQLLKIPLGDVAAQSPSASPTDKAGENTATQLFRLAALKEVGTAPAIATESHASLDQSATIHAPTQLWLILAQDITEQQHLARELTAKNADLMQLNRLKDEFLACISHELRTPLTAVLGLSSLLKDQTLGELNQRQVHYAQLIYQSGRHLMTVVNDILDLTRMETGQLELVLEPVNIPNVCQHAYDQACQLRLASEPEAEADATSHLPSFALEIEPGLDLIVVDELRLKQMLVHLLSNALKFTDTGRAIGLKVGYWGGWIAFTVWDTGIGIPADKQHLIFQKFQQLENPMTRRFEGTGLGLVLTQRLARLHGGDVTFISREGQGSQFTILLPPIPPDHMISASRGGANRGWDASDLTGNVEDAVDNLRLHQAVTPPAAIAGANQVCLPNHLENRLVLVVEAVPAYIENLSDLLSRLGYQVAIARSGTEALEKARRLHPCIVFLNPVLPTLAGWDVLKLLKADSETRQIPIVITTSKVDEDQANQLNADGFLSLPIQAKPLGRLLHKLVQPEQKAKLPLLAQRSLTILRLGHTNLVNPYQDNNAELTSILQACHYRILEADDLEQAELVARVWKPNVVLIESLSQDPLTYFQQLSKYPYLASLPLVTLDQETTQAANQLSSLLVFPCLTGGHRLPHNSATLIKVLQLAAGHTWQPTILAIDIHSLVAPSQSSSIITGMLNQALRQFPQETEWLHALAQYLQTAGFQAIVGCSWQEVWQQLQKNRVDLLLLCWTGAPLTPDCLDLLTSLNQLPQRPPILILDHRRSEGEAADTGASELPSILQELALQTLPLSAAMPDLLEQIRQAIGHLP